MPVRVRVRLKSLRNNRSIIVPALLNTGFTSNVLDIHVPRDIAEKLGLWPPQITRSSSYLILPGGEILGYYIPEAVELTVIEDDRTSKTISM